MARIAIWRVIDLLWDAMPIPAGNKVLGVGARHRYVPTQPIIDRLWSDDVDGPINIWETRGPGIRVSLYGVWTGRCCTSESIARRQCPYLNDKMLVVG